MPGLVYVWNAKSTKLCVTQCGIAVLMTRSSFEIKPCKLECDKAFGEFRPMIINCTKYISIINPVIDLLSFTFRAMAPPLPEILDI